MKKIKSKISIIVMCLVILIVGVFLLGAINKDKPAKVGSKANLESIYENRATVGQLIAQRTLYFFMFPWSGLAGIDFDNSYYEPNYSMGLESSSGIDIFNPSGSINTVDSTTNWFDGGSSSIKGDDADFEGDYSTTNIQVENVDEADIIKTDGEYIYSISDFSVVITDVRDESNPVIVSTIETDGPEEMMLYNDNLIIISSSTRDTEVEIYNIADKANPYKTKSFSLKQDYYTSRIANGNLYIISTGYLTKDSNGDVIDYYTEDSGKKYMDYDKMYYFKNNISRYRTVISQLNLEEDKASFDVSTYFVDLDNIYVSENNIYLAEEVDDEIKYTDILRGIFGLKGIYGIIDVADDYDYNEMTRIYKLELKDNGKVKFACSGTVDGTTINQFSFDEYESNLRVAIDTGDYTRVVVLDENLELIGQTEELAEDEDIYSSRFIGNRAYLVTYQTIDPLFVIDLSNPENPTVLGELKIPGYSTYLHPYDENHIIGIGMQTEERIYRNSAGKITSTTSVITGMKMALFDVSNVNNPKQISEIEIGDSRTKSAVLTNHKALLFSKEKELIAIPINSYKVDVDYPEYDDNIEDAISNYTKDYYGYVSEGYLVYNLNVEDGFSLKGLITHEGEEKDASYYKNSSNKLLRGVYIKDYLYTVSQHMLQVHKLENLEKISDIEI